METKELEKKEEEICSCEDWEPGIEAINGFIVLGWSHGIPYEGKKFQFCPWCGKKNEEIEFITV